MSARDVLARAVYAEGDEPGLTWLTTVDGTPNAASYELADRVLELHLVIPYNQDQEDRRFTKADYDEAIATGFFFSADAALEYVASQQMMALAVQRAAFQQAETRRRDDYERKVRLKMKAIAEHDVLQAAGLRGPDDAPKPVGVFVPKEFDEVAARKDMWPRYEIEEVRQA